MIKKVHHVGVVVRNMDRAMRFWRDTLGLQVHKTQTITEQGVNAALLRLGDSEIELLEPIVTDNGIARYLETRGEGLHHVCFQVDDVWLELVELRHQGVELIDQEPRIGIAGRICFLHPRAMQGTLVELCETLDEQLPADERDGV